ncbi:hypothetical protein BRADI_3g44491v3 [Brachypodium distachyon]|uniref:Uncharacterized protein n=1 Tax=Brachypodium distachyon TaxID=15368 RepID=A0A0Q3FJ20_BRADI|nr:hypothetical protein BRADI_3g44491v3 [Brachypodium distachyon]
MDSHSVFCRQVLSAMRCFRVTLPNIHLQWQRMVKSGAQKIQTFFSLWKMDVKEETTPCMHDSSSAVQH